MSGPLIGAIFIVLGAVSLIWFVFKPLTRRHRPGPDNDWKNEQFAEFVEGDRFHSANTDRDPTETGPA